MAMRVLFTAELFPLHELKGSMLTDAVVALNHELRTFFADKVELAPPIPTDKSNLIRAEKCYATHPAAEGQVWIQATVAAGFKLTDVEAARQLAETFTSANWPQILVDVLDPDLQVDPTKPFVPPAVQRQIDEQLARYGHAEGTDTTLAAASAPSAEGSAAEATTAPAAESAAAAQ